MIRPGPRHTLFLLALLAGPALAADTPPSAPLKPSSKWTVDYAEAQCRLVRRFGTGADEVKLQFTRDAPTGPWGVMIAGRKVGKAARGFNSAPAKLVFAPSGKEHAGNADAYRAADDGRFLRMGMKDLPALIGDPQADAELDFTLKYRMRVALSLGRMKAALAVMDACTDDLVKQWDFDPAAIRTQLSPPEPVDSPSGLADSQIYPTEMLKEGRGGEVGFRLIIDDTGRVESCTPSQILGGEAFSTTTCNSMMEKARFKPAIGADGKPARGYWISRVRFAIPQ